MRFKQENSLEKRKIESSSIIRKHPDKIPIICEKSGKSDLKELDKRKFLCPYNLTLGQFIWIIRKRMNLDQNKGLFILINNNSPSSSTLMSTLYDQHKDEDGFLYLEYSSETVFG